jgi:hypothetical protein
VALDYSLDIATELEPIQALHIVSDGLGLEWRTDTLLEQPGVQVCAIKNSELGQSVIEEWFGFRPTISVLFRIFTNEDYEGGKHTLQQATMELLRQVPGDAVLLFNGETIVLQRIGGQLVLNQGWGNWNASEMAAMTLPYELRKLP